MSGEWGLAQIGVALKGKSAAAGIDFRSAVAASPMARPAAAPVVRSADVPPMVRPAVAPGSPVERPVVAAPSVARRLRVPVQDGRGRIGARGIAYLVGTVLIVLLGWFLLHKRPVDSSGAVPVAAPQSIPAAGDSRSNTVPVPVAKTSAAVPVAAGAAVGGSGKWRVIAFTYNQEDQAQHKAAEIAQSHPDLSPSVFTPSGHAPFLVALGGPMSREDAFALSGKAKREGLPKDVYAQNYRRGGN